MDRSVGEYISELIATAQVTFRDVRVTRHDERLTRALIDGGRYLTFSALGL